MACKKECFEVTLTSCTDDIVVKAGLTPSTDYYWLIRDRHDNLYQRKVTTNLSGDLTIDADALPDGLLNKYAGILLLELRTGNDYLQKVNFILGEEEYSCVLMEFTEIDREEDDASEVNVIQFNDSVTPGAPTNTIETDTDFSISLTAGQVLEYISFTNVAAMPIKIGTTNGGTELLDENISDPQPRLLMHMATGAETIYISGIAADTTVKYKLS